MKYLSGTSICIYIIKAKPAQVIAKFRHAPVNTVAISSIPLQSLNTGLKRVLSATEQAGKTIGPLDMLIAVLSE